MDGHRGEVDESSAHLDVWMRKGGWTSAEVWLRGRSVDDVRVRPFVYSLEIITVRVETNGVRL